MYEVPVMLYARRRPNVLVRKSSFLFAALFLQVAWDEARAQTSTFSIHGVKKSCSDISQMDSALASAYEPFFSQWTAVDYTDAIAWSEACSAYGWHVGGRDRIALLRMLRSRALGPALRDAAASAMLSGKPVGQIVAPAVVASRTLVWSAKQELPADGSPYIGFNATVTSRYKDSLPDIGRRYGFGYEEIGRANPGVDMWLPGEGTKIFLPGRHRLPSGAREGVVVDLAERRLYFFPPHVDSQPPTIITYPVSIGMQGQRTPLGQTSIVAKVEHPWWHPPSTVRKAHAERGDTLPAAVGPGPDNPLGDHMMRLALGDGTFEIHGTNKPVSIGMDNTNGCIAMYPEDIAALFAMVRVGTPVRLINRSLELASTAR